MIVSSYFLLDSSNMTGSDQLSEVFDLVEIRGLLSGGFAVRGPWVSGGVVTESLKFVVMVRGRAQLTTDGVDVPMELEPGDVAILNNRTYLDVRGGTGDGPPRRVQPGDQDPASDLIGADRSADDIVIGGRVDLNPAGQALLQQALPPVSHVRASAATATNLRDFLDRLVNEMTGNRIGSPFAIRQYGQLLLLEVLRAYIDQAELPPGWLRALTDDHLRPAFTLMHTEPGKPWRLEELAAAAAMSRTSFAVRFRTVAGVPPLTYLNRWRMLLAQRALRTSDVRIGALAADLGFASDSAFSTAFKREVGESPLRYRYRVRDVPFTRDKLL
jgi:AraC-like DNA-binding protein